MILNHLEAILLVQFFISEKILKNTLSLREVLIKFIT